MRQAESRLWKWMSVSRSAARLIYTSRYIKCTNNDDGRAESRSTSANSHCRSD